MIARLISIIQPKPNMAKRRQEAILPLPRAFAVDFDDLYFEVCRC
jgi:hypothetical protein